MGHAPTKELNPILAHFAIPHKEYRCKPLTDGFINDTFLVMEEGNVPKYILQQVNAHVFQDIDGLMGNMARALEQLEDPTYAKITLIPTHSKDTSYSDGRGTWRLMTYIDQTTTYNTATNPRIAFEAGRIIGQFHVLTKFLKIEDFVDTIPRFHDLEWRTEQFQGALGSATSKKKEIARTAIDFALETLITLKDFGHEGLPLRICHNDTKLNNILFSKKDATALCLIDLDTLMKGYFYYDFGDAVRTIANSAPEDEQNHDRILFDRDLFASFVDGLAAVAPFLSKEEINTLPVGAVFMPFIHGLRALTDFLENNKYYKVAYENQNIDRCRSLFNFAHKALNELGYMADVVNIKLSSNTSKSVPGQP